MTPEKDYGFWARLKEILPQILIAIMHPIKTWRYFKNDESE